MVGGAPTDASGEVPREATHAAARRTKEACTRNVRRTVLRLVAEIGVGVAIAEVRTPDGDGEGDGVSGIPFARLTLELPSTVTITSNASPTQVDFASRREGACSSALTASYLGDGLRLFTVGDFKAGLGRGRD